MEITLFEEFQELRKKGIKGKEWCSQSRCRQLMAELHLTVWFKISERWLDLFKLRHHIRLRRPNKFRTVTAWGHCVILGCLRRQDGFLETIKKSRYGPDVSSVLLQFNLNLLTASWISPFQLSCKLLHNSGHHLTNHSYFLTFTW